MLHEVISLCPQEPCGCSLTRAAQAGNGGGDVSVPPAPRSLHKLRPPTHTLTPVLSLVCGSTAALTLTTTLCPGINHHPETTVVPVSCVCTEAGAARVEPGPSCCHHGDTSTTNKTIRDLAAHWGKPMVTEVSRARDQAGGHGRQDDRPRAKAHVSQGHHQAPMILPPQESPRAWSSACVQEGHHLPAQPVPRRWSCPVDSPRFPYILTLTAPGAFIAPQVAEILSSYYFSCQCPQNRCQCCLSLQMLGRL